MRPLRKRCGGAAIGILMRKDYTVIEDVEQEEEFETSITNPTSHSAFVRNMFAVLEKSISNNDDHSTSRGRSSSTLSLP